MAANTGRWSRVWGALTPREWTRVGAMAGFIVTLYVLGWGIFIVAIVPQHFKLLGIGVAITAYTLGLRHAFDADHISAIDNTTRKLMAEGKRPLSRGLLLLARPLHHRLCARGRPRLRGARPSIGAGRNPNSRLESFGGVVGTLVSGTFLYLIADLNLVILVGIVKVFRRHAPRPLTTRPSSSGSSTHRGLMFRFFGRLMRAITKPWQMYPVGVVFGIGFDTATEVALLAATAAPPPRGFPGTRCSAFPSSSPPG